MIEFYGDFMGTTYENVKHIDIEEMRRGNQLTMVQREQLFKPVTIQEINAALKNI